MKSKYLIALFFLPILIFSWSSFSQQTSSINTVNRPKRVPFKQQYLTQLKLPQGFRVSVFADNLGNPRMLQVRDDGGIYVTRPDEKDVLLLLDSNSDGRVDEKKTIVSGLKQVHGITIQNRKLYLCGDKELYESNLDGSNLRKLFTDLPDGGQHPKRTIGFGPDGLLYISVGSDCNNCRESNAEHATILQAGKDFNSRTIFIKGLRNTIGFGWHPETKMMWGMDHGSDGLGDDLPPEELNQLQKGDYGWPYCYNKRKVDPFAPEPKGTTKDLYCQLTKPSTLEYQAHSAPIAMVFYTGKQFPAQFKNNAFIAFHGSWNRSVPTGYKVALLKFENGKPTGFEDFLTGFLIDNGKNHFGRPAGLAVTNDGSLLVSDDSNGVIYRITYAQAASNK
jgi:glucose/arabinose dehydrogenase